MPQNTFPTNLFRRNMTIPAEFCLLYGFLVHSSLLKRYRASGIIAEDRSDNIVMGRVLEIFTFPDVLFRQFLLSAEMTYLIIGIPPERTIKGKGNESVRS